jgi:hypothetical protein
MGKSSSMAAIWEYAGRMALQDPALAVDAGRAARPTVPRSRREKQVAGAADGVGGMLVKHKAIKGVSAASILDLKHILRGNLGHKSKKEFFCIAISAVAGRFLLWPRLLGAPVKVRLPLCVSSLSKLRAALRSRPFLKSSTGMTGPPLAGAVAPPLSAVGGGVWCRIARWLSNPIRRLILNLHTASVRPIPTLG